MDEIPYANVVAANQEKVMFGLSIHELRFYPKTETHFFDTGRDIYIVEQPITISNIGIPLPLIKSTEYLPTGAFKHSIVYVELNLNDNTFKLLEKKR